MSIIIKDFLEYKSELLKGPYLTSDFGINTRIIINSDISINVNIYYSISTKDMTLGSIFKYQCPSNFWRNEEFSFL